VVAFGQFLPKRIRELPAKGYLINGHASLLPRHRGAAPIQHAILAGDRVTGVSIMRIEREMDAGPVALMREIAIGPEENAGELAARVAPLTAEALAEVVDRIADDEVVWTPQDDAAATMAPKIEREEAALDWSEAAETLLRRVRALAPTPGAFTLYEGEPLRVLSARALPGPTGATPGSVRRDEETSLGIATGDGWLIPLRLQRAGGKALETADFLRGRPIPDGTTLG
jgi:methionyl-tRNA formyltransferase